MTFVVFKIYFCNFFHLLYIEVPTKYVSVISFQAANQGIVVTCGERSGDGSEVKIVSPFQNNRENL